MKIAIVAQPYYPQRGGVSEHVHHTAAELRKLGHETDIVTSRFRECTLSESCVHRVGRNVLVPQLGALANMNVSPNLPREVAELFRRYEYDVVHIHEPLSPFLPWCASRQAREDAVVVGTFHAFTQRNWSYSLFRRFVEPYAKRLDARIAVSRSAESSVSRYFPDDYEVIPNGVDPERFRATGPTLESFDPKRPTVLFVGRFYPRKGLPILLDAMPRVLSRIPDARLLVVGDGPLRSWYHRRAARLGVTVEFLGELSPDELPRAYRSAHVLAVPSTGQESFGIVHLEAMASGLPIVASDIEGYRETLDPGREALLFPNRDATALADALVRALEDESLRRQMGAAGRRKSERFAWPRIARDLEALYLELLDRKRRIRLAS